MSVGFDLRHAAQGHVHQCKSVEQARPHNHFGAVLQHEYLQLLNGGLEEHRIDIVALPEQIVLGQFVGDLSMAIHLSGRLENTVSIERRQAE